MHWAAMQGSLEVLEFLLSHGASPDAHDPDPASGLVAYPLHWAAINARLMFCKVLLDNGAAVDSRGGDLNATPMMWAAKYHLPTRFWTRLGTNTKERTCVYRALAAAVQCRPAVNGCPGL